MFCGWLLKMDSTSRSVFCMARSQSLSEGRPLLLRCPRLVWVASAQSVQLTSCP